MAYTVPHTWVAGDFIRASWLQITTSDLIDHETRIAALVTVGGNVVGQASSVDSEIALFSGTGGKTIKRATTTGLLKAASGVIAAASAGTDYITPTGSEVLTNKTLTTPLLMAGVQLVPFSVSLTDAQIKALPTTAITLLAGQGASKRIVPLMVTIKSNFTAGAYTNVNATYSALEIAWALHGPWAATPIVNDNSLTTPLARLATFLGANERVVTLPPYVEAVENGASGTWGYPQPFVVLGAASEDNVALVIDIDNNGSGVLTGGNAANTLTASGLCLVIG